MKQDGSERILSLLGLAYRAGFVTVTVPAVCQLLRGRAGAAKRVYCPRGVSANTEKKLADKCRFYGVPLVRLDVDTDAFSKAFGKSAAVCAAALTDDGFAEKIDTYLD